MNCTQLVVDPSYKYVRIVTRVSENRYERRKAHIPGSQFIHMFELSNPIIQTDEGNWRLKGRIWEEVPGDSKWFIRIPTGEFGITADDTIQRADGTPRIFNPHWRNVLMFSDDGIVSAAENWVTIEYESVERFELDFVPTMARALDTGEFVLACEDRAQIIKDGKMGRLMGSFDDIIGIEGRYALLANGDRMELLAFYFENLGAQIDERVYSTSPVPSQGQPRGHQFLWPSCNYHQNPGRLPASQAVPI